MFNGTCCQQAHYGGPSPISAGVFSGNLDTIPTSIFVVMFIASSLSDLILLF